jgi:Tol biopolymer transport system component
MEGFNMCRRVIVAIALAAVTGGSMWAQTARTAEVQFKAAEHKEQAEGDLQGAIKEYEKVVSGRDRALAAQALLRIAEIHVRLGDAEAKKVYERLVRDFKEQTEAVSIARARLDREAAPARAGLGTRFPRAVPVPELSGAGVTGAAVSADGRYVAYVVYMPPRGEAIVVRDLRGGTVRTVSPTTSGERPNYVMSPAFSPDGKQLAYTWTTEQGYDLRVVNLQERGVPRGRTLLVNRYIQPFDWTPDGKSIVAAMVYPDKSTDISLINVADGAKRVVAPVLPGETWSSMFVSPDGNFLARDHRPGTAEDQYEVYVRPLSGGPEIRITEHPAEDRLVGWTPDGLSVLFTSDRGTGTPALYAQAIQNGKPSGRPTMITTDIGTLAPVINGIMPLRVTKLGALYYLASNRREIRAIEEIEIASFDFGTGTVGKPRLVGAERPGVNGAPAWSKDGKYLAYRSAREVDGGPPPNIVIVAVDSGTTRELRPGIEGVTHLDWSPDGRFLVTDSTATQNLAGIHKIDAQSGQASAITLGLVKDSPVWFPDGSRIVYRHIDPATKTRAFIEHNLATGAEREIIRRPALGDLLLSPDGRYIATGVSDTAAGKRRMLLIPVAGGEPRVLKEINLPQDMGVKMWAPDSRSIVVSTVRPSEAWRLPIDGPAVRLSDDALLPGHPAVHPDGLRIAVTRRSTPSQPADPQRGLWVLENFLPKAK